MVSAPRSRPPSRQWAFDLVAKLPADVSATPPPAPNPYASFLAESEEEF